MKRLFWVFLALLVTTAYHRNQHVDEAWGAEQAYWLVHDGVVRSELFRGMNGCEQQIFVFHKLFICMGALVHGWLGFTLPVGKAMSAFWALVGGLLIWWHLRWLGLAARWIYLALLLYVANGMLIEYAFIFRPETMYAALGLGSFSLLTRGKPLLAGLLAGLAVLTHLNGLCFVAAGAVWLVWQGQRSDLLTGTDRHQAGAGWQSAMGFGLVALGISSLYLADVLLANQLPMLWRQFSDVRTVNHVAGFADKLLITSKIHELLFHSEEEASMSALVLGVTGLTFWPQPERPRNQVRPLSEAVQTGHYLLLLLVAFALITKSNTDYYYLIFVPVMCIWVVQCVATWSGLKANSKLVRWRSYGLALLLGVYLLAGAYKAVVMIQSSMAQPDVVQKNVRLASLIGQPGARVIAPLDFFYNQQDNYRLHGLTYFHLLNQKHYGGQMSLEQFFQLAEADSAVAVVSDYGLGFSYFIDKEAPARVGHYRRVYQDDWNAVYLRNGMKNVK